MFKTPDRSTRYPQQSYYCVYNSDGIAIEYSATSGKRPLSDSIHASLRIFPGSSLVIAPRLTAARMVPSTAKSVETTSVSMRTTLRVGQRLEPREGSSLVTTERAAPNSQAASCAAIRRRTVQRGSSSRRSGDSPVYTPSTRRSPSAEWSNPTMLPSSAVVLKNRWAKGSWAMIPQLRLNVYWRPAVTKFVRSRLSLLSAEDAADVPCQF